MQTPDNKFGNGTEVAAGSQRMLSSQKSHILLRILALVLTLVAAIVAGVDKQSKVVTMQLLPGLPAVNVTAHAKWHYLSAFVYFFVANVIACTYAALSLILSFGKSGNKGLGLLIVIVDLLMVALLFSSGGATGAVGLLGFQGNSHVQWKKVCNVFGKFCNQIASALVLSMLGAIAFLFMTILALSGLHKRLK